MCFLAIALTIVVINLVVVYSSKETFFSLYYHGQHDNQKSVNASFLASSKDVNGDDNSRDEANFNMEIFETRKAQHMGGIVSVNVYDQPGCQGNVVDVSSKLQNTCLPAFELSSLAHTTGSYKYSCNNGEFSLFFLICRCICSY